MVMNSCRFNGSPEPGMTGLRGWPGRPWTTRLRRLCAGTGGGLVYANDEACRLLEGAGTSCCD
jgi:hypothetical protein